MNDSEAIEFYVQKMAEIARSMTLSDATNFLRGALKVAGEHSAMAGLKGTFIDLSSADDQLELIAHPQLRLPLNGKDGQQP